MVPAGLCAASEKVLTVRTTVLSVKWESSDSAAAGKAILESLAESRLKGGGGDANKGKVYMLSSEYRERTVGKDAQEIGTGPPRPHPHVHLSLPPHTMSSVLSAGATPETKSPTKSCFPLQRG